MVVCEQLNALISFMEKHRELALGNLSRTTEGRTLSKKLWANCAQILNNTGGEGPIKSASEWRTFYNEYKAKTLKKIKLRRRETYSYTHTPDDMPIKPVVITPLQERLYQVLRNPQKQIQEEPLPEGRLQTPHRFNTSVDIEPQNDTLPSSYNSSCSYEPPRQRPRRESEPVEDRNDALESAQTSLEAAQVKLERIEKAYVKAISEQTQATNRLAAAVEEVAHGRVATALEHIASSLALYIQKVKREPESGTEE